MHANAARLHKLFTALHAHDHEAMASCYHPKARFHDIAFDLEGAADIRDMWRMICREETDIRVDVQEIEAGDRTGRARTVDTYMFGASKREDEEGVEVINKIESRFEFTDGLIMSQIDDCDPKEWARQAMGSGIKGFLAGRLRIFRSRGAWKKLKQFREDNPE